MVIIDCIILGTAVVVMVAGKVTGTVTVVVTLAVVILDG